MSGLLSPIIYVWCCSAGEDLPKGRDAIGWRVAVYWKDDRTFYEGDVRDFDNSTGRHKVLYNDGEEEWLSLRNERVIWRLPPTDETDDEDDLDDDEDDDHMDEATDPVRVLSSKSKGQSVKTRTLAALSAKVSPLFEYILLVVLLVCLYVWWLCKVWAINALQRAQYGNVLNCCRCYNSI